jgi:hypothetical protein
MDFNFYQDEAKKTIQKNSSNGDSTEIVPFLGIIGGNRLCSKPAKNKAKSWRFICGLQE